MILVMFLNRRSFFQNFTKEGYFYQITKIQINCPTFSYFYFFKKNLTNTCQKLEK